MGGTIGNRARFVFGGVLLVAGCGGNTGVYAVSVTEPLTIQCSATSEHGLVPQKELDRQAKAARLAWADYTTAEPPTAAGRELRVVETEDAVQAWFSSPGGAGGTLSSPEEVYVGSPNEGYVEGTYVDRYVVPTPEGDEELPFPCGEELRSAATLSVTVDGDAVEGRVRRTEYVYIATDLSACAARLDCVRNILVVGRRE